MTAGGIAGLPPFAEWGPIGQSFGAGLVSWSGTALGASLVFFTARVHQGFLDVVLGFAGGVMLAASFWSLLHPAIELSADYGPWRWLPASAGILLGIVFLHVTDQVLPRLQLAAPAKEAKGLSSHWRRTTLLILAIALHNIPEGLALGVVFGAIGDGASPVSLAAAVGLMAGIAFHNLPEGMAVALPLRREGLSPLRSFLYGQLSAAVEPLAAVAGAAAALTARAVLPYAMGFAASAMLYVVVREVIPETQLSGHPVAATLGIMLGFTLMMALSVSLG
ncbi:MULTISPECIES: ZIP family metal transporter [Methylococcus]|jgi:ZIP family zinc transporter|uniref:ZIP zinc transporter family protein n=1 Tax=Methylococcus capsulatus (strain ATCC 33009 / NCIMB 11132 / Bath) TaxID=243233 RepID=Q607N1_METCA|nr:ZIP family metal transporter [Methylococcus capsulatus]AAU91996.1 ZIP zinc transporter family protein [Methylococcus capsulatus str. Bath]QXP87618.1 ZIP family metal transporter [Methylococcus capsulatus]QXP92642.1 ZIP family metal transporter [Methylococcus capsulatus]UQN12633.1 ZIP family metal transporter [Methylococcus capsulatus]